MRTSIPHNSCKRFVRLPALLPTVTAGSAGKRTSRLDELRGMHVRIRLVGCSTAIPYCVRVDRNYCTKRRLAESCAYSSSSVCHHCLEESLVVHSVGAQKS